MDLLIYCVNDPGDWPMRAIYINNKLYTSEQPTRPYKDDFWIDLINNYIEDNSIHEVNNVKVISTYIDFWNYHLKVLDSFSDYPIESFYHFIKDSIIMDGTFEQIKKDYYSNPKNRKQYVLIRRDGKYYSDDGKFYKDLDKARKDNYYNLEYIMRQVRLYDKRISAYDIYDAGIVLYDRMKYLEETYRSISNAYFANVFNKCCKYKYLRCWK